MSTLGSRLRYAREKKGWSQTYVCRKLGISNSTLSGYERDYREPDAEMISVFAQLYEVSTDDLLGHAKTNGKEGYGGTAFFGGPDNYTDEELDVARAAIEAYRKMKGKGK